MVSMHEIKPQSCEKSVILSKSPKLIKLSNAYIFTCRSFKAYIAGFVVLQIVETFVAQNFDLCFCTYEAKAYHFA